MPLWGNREPPKALENNIICLKNRCGLIQVLQLLEKWKTSPSSSELIPCHFLASVAQIEFFSSHFNYFLSALRNVICQKLPPRVPALSNWAHQALWEGGNMVQTSGWTPPSSYSTLGDPRKSSPCSDRPHPVWQNCTRKVHWAKSSLQLPKTERKLSHWTERVQIHLRCILMHPTCLCMIIYNMQYT